MPFHVCRSHVHCLPVILYTIFSIFLLKSSGRFMKILIAIILSTIYFAAPCQPCASFFFEPKKIEWLRYNARGIQEGTLIYSISAQSLKNNSPNATVNVQLYDRNAKLLNTGSYSVKCLGQYINVDMRFFIPAQQVEQYMSPTAKMTCPWHAGCWTGRLLVKKTRGTSPCSRGQARRMSARLRHRVAE